MLNSKKIILIITSSVFLISTALFAITDNTYNLKFVDGSSVWIEGDTNVHAYKTTTSDLGLNTELVFKTDPVIERVPIEQLLAEKSYQPKVRELVLNLVVEKFHSSTLGFDNKFNETMKYKEHPNIVFIMTSSSIAPDGGNNRFHIKTDGILKIAGSEKPVSINSLAVVEGQNVRLIGSKDFLMTDFGIEPPRLLFMKTDDKVTVKWDLILAIANVNK